MRESNHVVPMVIEQDGRSMQSYDIFSRLLKDRIVFVGGIDSDYRADLISAQLLFLSHDDPHKDIFMYVNSPGGIVTAGLAIYDTMQYIPNQVNTVVLGQAASMGAVLAAAGAKGKRYVLPNARIMIHQPLGGAQGQQTDVRLQALEMERIRVALEKILSQHTGQELKKVNKDCERDNFMSADEAVKYGLADKVVSSLKDISGSK